MCGRAFQRKVDLRRHKETQHSEMKTSNGPNTPSSINAARQKQTSCTNVSAITIQDYRLTSEVSKSPHSAIVQLSN